MMLKSNQEISKEQSEDTILVIRRYQRSDLKIPTVWSEYNKRVIRKKQRGNYKTLKGLSEGTQGEIRTYWRSNQEISNGNKRCKSKDRHFNVQDFGDVKWKIDHCKLNRVHTIQWTKEKKHTMICKALHKKLNIEQQKTRGWTKTILCHMLNSKTKQSTMTKAYCDITCGLVQTQALQRRY